jgi:kynurenine formamidase
MTTKEVLALHDTLSNWGRWGAEDQLGALNFITPESRRAAAGLVRTGMAVSCARSLPTQPSIDNPMPVAHHMTGTATEGGGADYFAVAPHGYATSHIDALCHIFRGEHLYNGYPATSVTAHGALQLGIHHLASGVVGRGVLLDIPALRGVEALAPGEAIYPDDLEAAEEGAGVQVGTGDLLLVRTGRWPWRAEYGPWDPHQAMAGLDASCLRWLHERQIAVLGSDGVSDVVPSGVPDVRLPIHAVAIPTMGVHLLDNLDLEALAGACRQEARWVFLLTVAPLVLWRGTASPVNPIALF